MIPPLAASLQATFTMAGLNGPRTSTATVIVAIASICGLGALLLVGRETAIEPTEPVRSSPSPAVSTPIPPSPPPIDWRAVRREAWEKIAPRVAAAERESKAEIDRQLAPITQFFDERKGGSLEFAKAILSLSGKWVYVKSKLPLADHDGHFAYLQQQFEERLFTPQDVQRSIESAVAGYIGRLAGIENQLLVDIRADLTEKELPLAQVMPALASDEQFRREYQDLLVKVTRQIASDLKIDFSRELVSLVAGEVAAKVALRVGVAVAARLGMSAGVLSIGAGSSWATFGVGLVAAVIIDAALAKAIRAAGYDAEKQVAEKVNETLDHVRALLVDGDPGALEVYEKLRRMERDDPDATVRADCRASADRIAQSGNLGLRRELVQIHSARTRLRTETLRRMILDQDHSEEIIHEDDRKTGIRK
jgi:hypothetical protein